MSTVQRPFTVVQLMRPGINSTFSATPIQSKALASDTAAERRKQYAPEEEAVQAYPTPQSFRRPARQVQEGMLGLLLEPPCSVFNNLVADCARGASIGDDGGWRCAGPSSGARCHGAAPRTRSDSRNGRADSRRGRASAAVAGGPARSLLQRVTAARFTRLHRHEPPDTHQ